ncbi:MAG: hypothetical protein IKM51_04285 [Oscillospiraceae bacterium]|nr:hypothetical protein [Oscillospiraceae bacterium]
MRRSLALLLVLFILLSGFLVYAQAQINAPREDVLIEHELLAGDPSAAEGITLSASYCSGDHLYWDTKVTLGSQPQYDTKYDWAAKSRPYVPGIPQPSFYLYDSSGYGISGHVDLESDGAWIPYIDVVRQVAQRTPAGKERIEFIDLAQHTQFLDLGVGIDYIDDVYYIKDGQVKPQHIYSDSFDEYITDFFRIPVPEDYLLKIRIEKREDGEIYSLDIATDYNVYLESSCVRADDGLYFTLSASGGDGFDASYIPGGFGIYHLPIELSEEYGVYIADLKGISNVHSFGKDIGPSKLFMAGGRLCMTYQEDGAAYLEVFEVETMEPLQKIKLSEKIIEPESSYIHTAIVKDGYAVLWGWNDVLHVLSIKDGALCHEFTADLGDMIPYGTQSADTHIIFDGERLAVTACDSWRSNESLAYRYYDSTSVLVAVYTKNGLEYYARFNHSFDELAKISFNTAPHMASRDALKLEFTK